MHTRLWLVSHAATAAMRAGRFPSDDPLDARGIADVHAYRERFAQSDVPHDASVFVSPALCARETADALGLAAQPAPALADMDYGHWRGQRVADVAADDPAALSAWSTDPDAVVPGGESFAAVAARVARWLDALDDVPVVVAVTHAVVIRAAVLHALQASLAAGMRVEIGPLSRVELRRSMRGWVWSPGA